MSCRPCAVGRVCLRWAVLGVGLTVLVGCSGGQSGPQRYDLSGKVAYGGVSVPAGEIVFMPDAEKGNQGPGTVAVIQDGTYRTAPGKGPVAGPHVAILTGYGKGEPTKPAGSPPLLFTERRVKFHVSADKPTVDFNLSP